jgi:hypothetical protein
MAVREASFFRTALGGVLGWMRGSAHSDDAYRLRIRPGGLHIEEMEEPAP